VVDLAARLPTACGRRNLEISADLPRKEMIDFTVSGNSGYFLRLAIDVDGMIATLTQQFTMVSFQVLNQIPPLHWKARLLVTCLV